MLRTPSSKAPATTSVSTTTALKKPSNSRSRPSFAGALSSVALSVHAVAPTAPPTDILKEGYLMKKRRRKMSGPGNFVRRYFRLHASGILSYGVHPDMSPRDQIFLPSAVIASAFTPGHNILHIDSDYSTFHIRFKDVDEADEWMAAIRTFIGRSTTAVSADGALTSDSSHKLPQDILGDMASAVRELNDALSALKAEDFNLKSPAFFKFKRDKESTLGGVIREGESFLHKLRKNSYPDTTSNPISRSSSFTTQAPGRPDNSTRSTPFSRLDRINSAVQTVTGQYEQLVQSVAQMPVVSRQSAYPGPDNASLTSLHRRRTSVRTVMSASPSDNVWYDALENHREAEGGEEIFLESDPSDERSVSDEEVGTGEDVDSDTLAATMPEDENGPTINTIALSPESIPITRRTILPAPISGDEGSLFSALKKNIGKDLSNVSFPVSFNEPLSLLQRLCEDMEYSNLLEQAVSSSDPVERMCYVAAFAVSGYACTKMRTGRKSFTPMMGETFEDVRTNFIAEKVSHSPLIMACHAHGIGWEYWSTHSGKTKFWGKSLEIVQTGTTHLRIGDDCYEWQRPSTFVRNLMMGTKYLEHCGQLTIVNTRDKMRCALEFKETGYWGTSPNVVAGGVYSASGAEAARLEGTWHEQLAQVLDASHLKLLWKATAFPRHAPEYYGLTEFATTLNEISLDIEGKLPMTDSRYRPDIRAMECGDVVLAGTEKMRLEELQRQRRDKKDPLLTPKWFVASGRSGEDFEYSGGYWEARAKGWKTQERVW